MALKSDNEYLNGVFSNLDKVGEVAFYLHDLGVAFGATGNGIMERRLIVMSEQLDESRKGINNAVSKEANRKGGGW